jgi:hypothetical protein
MATLTRALLALVAVAGCGHAPLDRNGDGGYPNHNDPNGRIEGTLLYEGPAPAVDAAGQPIGRVVLLLFRADNPPPPEGFASTAETVQSFPATQLFQSVTALPNGRVRASVPFVFPEISTPGEYQLRAFVSGRDEARGFHPLFSVRNQPQRGDVGGGAVVDPTVQPPAFARIPIGVRTDTPQGPRWSLPEVGAVTRGVTVFLGAPFPEDRPVFRMVDAPPPQSLGVVQLPARPNLPAMIPAWAAQTGYLASSARALVLPSNLPPGLPDNPAMLAQALPSFSVEVGLPANEVSAARNAGVFFDSNLLRFTLGPLYRPAHPTLLPVPGPTGAPVAIPWTFPLVLLVKLHDPTNAERALLAQAAPDPVALSRVITALNQPERTPGVAPIILIGAMVPPTGLAGIFTLPTAPQRAAGARVVVSPIAVEVGADGSLTPIVPRLPPALAGTLARIAPNARCSDAGLPAGRYGLTLVTPSGQTWSLPNDLAPVALAPNLPTAAPSQGLFVRIDAAPPNAAYVCPPRL